MKFNILKSLGKVSILTAVAMSLTYLLPIAVSAYEEFKPLNADMVTEVDYQFKENEANVKLVKSNIIKPNRNSIISVTKDDKFLQDKIRIKDNIKGDKFVAIFNENGLNKAIDCEIDYPVEITVGAAEDSKLVSRIYFKNNEKKMFYGRY